MDRNSATVLNMPWIYTTKRQWDALFLILLIALAIYLWPVWILLGVYLLGRYLHRLFLRRTLLKEVRRVWTEKGIRILFFTSNNKRWSAYFETELLPKIASKTQVVNWSTRMQDGWDEAQLEARIVRLCTPWYSAQQAIAPAAFVLLPSGQMKTVQLKDAFTDYLKSSKSRYKELEQELLALI